VLVHSMFSEVIALVCSICESCVTDYWNGTHTHLCIFHSWMWYGKLA